MANGADTSVSAGSELSADPALADAALQHRPWRSWRGLSSRLVDWPAAAARVERHLDQAGFDRAPWLAVGFGTGIGLWYALGSAWQWRAVIALGLAVALAAAAVLNGQGRFPYLRLALITIGLVVAAGCATIWARAAMVEPMPIARAMAPTFVARVLERTDEPAEQRLRLVLATREARSGRAIRVRLTVLAAADQPGLAEGAIVRVRARLMPPQAPQLPGSFDFARAAWFEGIAASGGIIGPLKIVVPAAGGHWVARAQHALADHIRGQIAGSPGGIAAVLATGERGGISAADAQAMRDAGLAHLLAVSGLHVSAVVALAYVLAFRLLALVPPIALRVRLPLLAACAGGIAGAGYTVLTGAQVGTVRACLGALLVLAALALGRQPLSLRLLGVAALVMMVLWPQTVVSPGFQMSFGSVLAILALHDARPMREFLARRPEPWWARLLRRAAMLLLTGMVIDLALMPVALFHFHRAGIYGALANLVAIPLTTFVTMPLIGLSLALDLVGLGRPVWWLAARSLDILLAVAHGTAELPGSVTMVPALGTLRYGVFVAAMLWLALWRGRLRLLAVIPALGAAASLAWLRPPDVMITGDGRNLGLVSDHGDKLVILRDGRSRFTRDQMLEIAGMAGAVTPLDGWPGARCNRDFCLVQLNRGGRMWHLLIARRTAKVADDALAQACAAVDIVIAEQQLAGPCHPGLLKADRGLLMRTGGLALDLANRQITTVAAGQGDHPWWRAAHRPQADYDGEPVSSEAADPAADPTVGIVKALPP